MNIAEPKRQVRLSFDVGPNVPRCKGDRLRHELLLPFGVGQDEGKDHAESFALLHGASGKLDPLMVVYDGPADHRCVDGPTAVRADVFAIG